VSDYKQYVSFEISDEAIEVAEENGYDEEDLCFSDEMQASIEKALAEIASTPEGLRLLKDAASKSPDGKIPIFQNVDGFTLAIPPYILIGTDDSDFKAITLNGGDQNMSLQRLLFHELQHLENQTLRGDEDQYGISASRESEAVRETNKFMKKYYNEPSRSEDTNKGNFDGTEV